MCFNLAVHGVQKMINFSICNIFVNPGDTSKPNVSLDT